MAFTAAHYAEMYAATQPVMPKILAHQVSEGAAAVANSCELLSYFWLHRDHKTINAVLMKSTD